MKILKNNKHVMCQINQVQTFHCVSYTGSLTSRGLKEHFKEGKEMSRSSYLLKILFKKTCYKVSYLGWNFRLAFFQGSVKILVTSHQTWSTWKLHCKTRMTISISSEAFEKKTESQKKERDKRVIKKTKSGQKDNVSNWADIQWS